MAAMMRLAFLYVIATVPFVAGRRFGSSARTLHLAPDGTEHDLGAGYWRFRAKDRESVDNFVAESLSRVVRDAAGNLADTGGPTPNVTHFPLTDDHHNEMIVHWAGAGSDIIIALTRDMEPNQDSTSQVYVSTDYGVSFQAKQDMMKLYDGRDSIIDKFYHSEADNSRYIFTDVIHSEIWIATINERTEFIHARPGFKPTLLSTHKSDINVVLGMESGDAYKRLWKSEDFGQTWHVMQANVKSFWWGSEGYDPPTRVYVEREEPGQSSTVIYSDDYFDEESVEHELIADVVDFEVLGEYMFATRHNSPMFPFWGSHSDSRSTLSLWVSNERKAFQEAQFPSKLEKLDFYIADASEDQVFVCVNHNKNDSITHLYISDATGISFSLSLENVVYYSPEGPGKDTWLSFYADEPFAEIHKVEGLRGIYIASQFGDTTKGFHESNMVSVITFDKGGVWERVKAPSRDSEGHVLAECNMNLNCSLHLSQKYSMLYPGTRRVPILSKQSAPGLIMASGSIGETMQADPSVFLSTTAGVAWFEVLKDNYFFTFGDHGGLIVAVRQYSPIDSIKYSWNEGETWSTLKFEWLKGDKIRVYGLMTEPGEHTTVFTLFGSKVDVQHTWLIIQVNLSAIFQHSQCGPDDYKTWSPGEEKPGQFSECLMGSKQTFERRIAHAKCFNGEDYDRPISEETCICTREDFECDFGFRKHDFWSGVCHPDEDSGVDPYAVPVPCPEGSFYRRTKGYRKVSGDTCRGGLENRYEADQVSCPVSEKPEFLLYAMRTEIKRYILGENRQETLPLRGLQNAIAVDFDYSDNCVYWADMIQDHIKRYCLNGSAEQEVIASGRLDTVEAIAYDWQAENIYWIDSGTRRLEVARKTGLNRKMLFNESHSLDNPRALAIDPARGYMYWTDWGAEPHIRKAFMDGSHTEIIISTNIRWPNGIVIDDQTLRIYWTDAYFDRIETANFDGTRRHVLISEDVPHPYAIGVYKNDIYWDDWYKKAILKANKYDGSGKVIVVDNLDSIMDMKVLHQSSQQDKHNPCSRENGGCSQLCLVKPGEGNTLSRSCRCDDMTRTVITPGGIESCECESGEHLIGGACIPSGATCDSDQFTCANEHCIPARWKCDRDNDCGDMSDEQDCRYETCSPYDFSCDNNRCIPERWRCDFDNDCYDWSDEKDCDYPTCDPEQFTCANHRCIPQRWVCDFDNDCHDMSDEQNCTFSTTSTPFTVTVPSSCKVNDFTCNNGHCIPSYWQCDGDNDCGDFSDEPDTCSHPVNCTDYQFQCTNGRCISRFWQCDGEDDCNDGSDEAHCPGGWSTTTSPSTSRSPCTSWQFTCFNGNCVSYWWKCDGVNDCGDNSDEYDCSEITTTMYPTTYSTSTWCQPYQFQCGASATTRCIPNSWVCDYFDDCGDGSDEIGCPGLSTERPVTAVPCQPHSFRCHDGRCIPQEYRCNRYRDCVAGEDEENCHTVTPTPGLHCRADEWMCPDGMCILMTQKCDSKKNCLDGSDESEDNCRFQVHYLDATALDYKTASVSWGDPQPPLTFQFHYILSWNEVGNPQVISNKTISSEAPKRTSVKVDLLKGGSSFEFKVTLRKDDSGQFYPTYKTVMITTPDGIPSAPTGLTLHGNPSQSEVEVHWNPPQYQNGSVISYKIRYRQDGSYDYRFKLTEQPNTNVAKFYIEQKIKYFIQIAARTSAGLGPYTDEKSIILTKNIPGIPINLTLTKLSPSSAHLRWSKASGKVQMYTIYYAWPYTDDSIMGDVKCCTTPLLEYTVSDLAPGVTYIFKVTASNSEAESLPSKTVNMTTPGNRLPRPTNLQAIPTGIKSMRLTWIVDDTSKHWVYSIFYGKGGRDLFNHNMTVNSMRADITGLESYVEYLFIVEIVGPNGKGPQSDPCVGTTNFDFHLQPRDVRALPTNFTTIQVTWKSPRDLPTKLNYTIYYRVKSVNETEFQSVIVPETQNTTLNCNISGLIPGAMYTIKVTSGGLEALIDDKTLDVKTPSSSPPTSLKALLQFLPETKDYGFQLDWIPPTKIFNKDLGYAIFVATGYKPTNWTYHSHSAINTTAIHGLKPGTTYNFKVCTDQYKNYYGEFSEVVQKNITELKPDGQHSFQKSSKLAAIVAPTLAVIGLLSVALVVFVVRHQRLQRSFTQFANSHYDSRSGTTTFSVDGDGLGEEEETPMIRGFSDDEPLVVA